MIVLFKVTLNGTNVGPNATFNVKYMDPYYYNLQLLILNPYIPIPPMFKSNYPVKVVTVYIFCIGQ